MVVVRIKLDIFQFWKFFPRDIVIFPKDVAIGPGIWEAKKNSKHKQVWGKVGYILRNPDRGTRLVEQLAILAPVGGKIRSRGENEGAKNSLSKCK